MTTRFQEAVQMLSQATGWTPSAPDESGKVFFDLDALRFALFTPDGRRLFFIYELFALSPDDNLDECARQLARMAAAVARTRRSVLSLRNFVFTLHQEVDLARQGASVALDTCEAFLNDCDWWRTNAQLDAS